MTDGTAPMTRDDVDVISLETPFQGYFRIDRYTLRHRTYDGGWGAPITREVFERGHAAAVLLYDPQRDVVGLIEQFRAGAYAAQWDPWIIECVAGIIEPGETAIEVARRETVEESGSEALDIIPICNFIVTPGGSSETCWLFCARVDSSTLGGVHGLAHEGEDIKVITMTSDEAYAMVKAGKIPSLMATAAIQWLMLERDSLRQCWAD